TPRRGRGRPQGAKAKYPRILKEAILIAAELEGSDGKGKDQLVGFLRRVIKKDIRVFAYLLGRTIPYQVEGRLDVKQEVIYRSVDEVRAELMSRGIPLRVIDGGKVLDAEPVAEYPDPARPVGGEGA